MRYVRVAAAVGVLLGCSIDTEGLAGERRPDGGTGLDAPVDEDCVPTSPALELCDGLDNDCDPATPDGAEDPDVDLRCDGADDDVCTEGSSTCVGGRVVCDDFTTNTHETCNATDDDCDGAVDEDAIDAPTWYPDADGDGFGLDHTSVVSCEGPAEHAVAAGDCDDGAPAIHPTATETCNLVDDDCTGAIDDAPGCACVGHVHDDTVYLFCVSDAVWFAAQSSCESQGAHLVYVDDMPEHAFLIDRATRYRPGVWWIGLTDTGSEGTWSWSDGSVPTFLRWGPGEPNDGNSVIVAEDCAEMNTGGAWNDTECDDHRPYICEVP